MNNSALSACLLWSFPCPAAVQTLAWGVTGIKAWRMAFSQPWATSSPTPVAARTGLWWLLPLFSPTKYTMVSVMISKQYGLLPCTTFEKSRGWVTWRISESGISWRKILKIKKWALTHTSYLNNIQILEALAKKSKQKWQNAKHQASKLMSKCVWPLPAQSPKFLFLHSFYCVTPVFYPEDCI